jgi:hypothetical protein
MSFPEAGKRYEERCPKVTQPLLSTVVKKGIDSATETTSSLVSPSTSQYTSSKKVNACTQTDVAMQTEVPMSSLSPGQNCGHICLKQVLENGQINRVANDNLGAHLQGITVRTPGLVPILVLENRQARLL